MRGEVNKREGGEGEEEREEERGRGGRRERERERKREREREESVSSLKDILSVFFFVCLDNVFVRHTQRSVFWLDTSFSKNHILTETRLTSNVILLGTF